MRRLVSLLASFALLSLGTVLLLCGVHLGGWVSAPFFQLLAFSHSVLAYWISWFLWNKGTTMAWRRAKKKGILCKGYTRSSWNMILQNKSTPLMCHSLSWTYVEVTLDDACHRHFSADVVLTKQRHAGG